MNAKDERGFTFIELLVVMLMIGILAAIAIPSFLNQGGKAVDAGAKTLATSAQIAAEVYATDTGSYSNLTAAALNHYEATIPTTSGTGAAYVSNVTASATSYSITTTPAHGGETYTVTRHPNGSYSRSCTAPGGTGGGCVGNTW